MLNQYSSNGILFFSKNNILLFLKLSRQKFSNLSLNSREGSGNPLQYSCLENSMEGGAWQAAVRGVTMNRTRLSDFTFTFHFHALEKEMATHSSVLAWRIPGMAEPGGLPSMKSHSRTRLSSSSSLNSSGSTAPLSSIEIGVLFLLATWWC